MSSSVPLPVQRQRIVTVLNVLTLLGNMSLQILLPAMPAVQAEFNATPGGVQLLVSLSFFVYGFAMLIYGPVADVYGRRPVYLTGMIVYTLGNIICTLAPTLTILILGRVVASAGSSVSMVLGRAIVRDVFEGHETSAVMARISMVAAIAPMIAPPVGGVITDLFGWRALFVVLSLSGVVSVTLIYLALPETLKNAGHEIGRRFSVGLMVSSFWSLLRDRRYAAYAFNGAFVSSMFFVYMTAAPFVYIGLLHLSATTYAFYYIVTIVGFLVGYAIAARSAGRMSVDRILILASIGGLGAALVGVAFVAADWWTVWTLTIPVVFLTIANGIVTPNSAAAVVSGDPRTIGAASGLAGFLQMMVGALLIQAVGMLPHDTPMGMTSTMAFSGALAVIVIVWGLAKPTVARD